MRIGLSLLAIAVLHCAVGIVLYAPQWTALLSEGVIATVGDFGDRAAAFWFMIAGLTMATLALAIHTVERFAPLPHGVSLALAALGLVIVLPMPVSGGWLFLPLAWCAWKKGTP